MTDTVISGAEPRDLVAFVMYAFGYRLRDSLVLACLGAPRGRVGALARQDLAPRIPGAYAEQARTLTDCAVQAGVDRVVLVAFTDSGMHPALLATLRYHLTTAGVELVDAFEVGQDRYSCLTCDGPCCPSDGWPLSDLQASRVGAEMVLQGQVLAGERAGVVGDLSPLEPAVVTAVAEAADRHEQAWRCAGTERVRRRVVALALWTSCLRRDPESLSSEELGVLTAALGDLAVRDAVIFSAVPGGSVAAEHLVAGDVDEEVTAMLDATFGGATGPSPSPVRPDPELADRAGAQLRRLARATAGERQARALGVMTWLAWWRGEGVLADELLGRLLAADPSHSLGHLLRTALDHRVRPPWVAPARRVRAS